LFLPALAPDFIEILPYRPLLGCVGPLPTDELGLPAFIFDQRARPLSHLFRQDSLADAFFTADERPRIACALDIAKQRQFATHLGTCATFCASRDTTGVDGQSDLFVDALGSLGELPPIERVEDAASAFLDVGWAWCGLLAPELLNSRLCRSHISLWRDSLRFSEIDLFGELRPRSDCLDAAGLPWRQRHLCRY
jgi:hypothetical protein